MRQLEMEALVEETPESIDISKEVFLEEFLARPCTLGNCEVTLSGFQDDADARDVWNHLQNWLNVFGRIMNVVRLHRLTITFDYAAALAQIDQGTGTGDFVTPTNDEFATGVAMAVPILVDGVPRIHLVGNAALFSLLRNEDTKESAIALYTPGTRVRAYP